MKKVLVLLCCSSSIAFADELKTTSEFVDLGEPEKEIGGAYGGFGVALSRISHKLDALGNFHKESFRSSSNQWDLSLIGGFGSAFYKKYYIGIEMDFFRRAGSGANYSSNKAVAVVHNSSIGLNMDVRFGYLYPQQGYLIYATAGFARVVGRGRFQNANNYLEGSFGSFYPTFGIGFEKKVTHKWNIRADFHASVTSKDENKSIAGTYWKYEAKPNRMAIRISVTRSI
jgi:hypothetical protein